MAGQQNALDGIAEELFGWMDSEVSYYVDALKGGPNGRAPFAAETSEAEKKAFYTRQMFQAGPDGSIQYDQPNAEGRAKLMQRVGPQSYAEIFEAVRPKQGRRPVIEPEEPDEEV